MSEIDSLFQYRIQFLGRCYVCSFVDTFEDDGTVGGAGWCEREDEVLLGNVHKMSGDFCLDKVVCEHERSVEDGGFPFLKRTGNGVG